MSSWHRVLSTSMEHHSLFLAPDGFWLCTDAHGQAAVALPRDGGTTSRGQLPTHTLVSWPASPLILLHAPPLLRCPSAVRGSLFITDSLLLPRERGPGECPQDPHSCPGAFSGLKDCMSVWGGEQSMVEFTWNETNFTVCVTASTAQSSAKRTQELC